MALYERELNKKIKTKLKRAIHKVLTYIEYRALSGVFRTIDPVTPSLPSECVLPQHQRRGGGGVHSRRKVRGVGGQHFGRRQTLDWPLTV
jgi:hypothetical protein